jgi:hypothetical protein
MSVRKIVGGYLYFTQGYYSGYKTGLLVGSSDINKAHTNIYIEGEGRGPVSYRIIAKGNSPFKTNRGIIIGAAKSTVLAKYGLPTDTYSVQSASDNITYEVVNYHAKEAGKALHTDINFRFLKSNGTLMEIHFYLGEYE